MSPKPGDPSQRIQAILSTAAGAAPSLAEACDDRHNPAKSPQAVGTELGVAFVPEGSVRKAGMHFGSRRGSGSASQ